MGMFMLQITLGLFSGQAPLGAEIKALYRRFANWIHTYSDPFSFGFTVKHLDLFAFDA